MISAIGPNYRDLRVLITVKTYPTPSAKHIETVCTAGVTEDGDFGRLYPIPVRLLAGTQQFKKYQSVRLRVKKSSDPRPESCSVDEQSIQVEDGLGTDNGWEDRKRLILPLQSTSVEELRDEQERTGKSLGLIRPARIDRFTIRRASEDQWSENELAKLTRQDMFRDAPKWMLEKLPYEFHYEFHCDDPRCQGHDMQTFDWEVGQSYRDWSRTYGAKWQAKMQEKYADELVKRRDLHFFLGTIAGHPKSWTIIGLFYPPLPAQSQVSGDGFQGAGQNLGNGETMTQGRLFFEA